MCPNHFSYKAEARLVLVQAWQIPWCSLLYQIEKRIRVVILGSRHCTFLFQSKIFRSNPVFECAHSCSSIYKAEARLVLVQAWQIPWCSLLYQIEKRIRVVILGSRHCTFLFQSKIFRSNPVFECAHSCSSIIYLLVIDRFRSRISVP